MYELKQSTEYRAALLQAMASAPGNNARLSSQEAVFLSFKRQKSSAK